MTQNDPKMIAKRSNFYSLQENDRKQLQKLPIAAQNGLEEVMPKEPLKNSLELNKSA